MAITASGIEDMDPLERDVPVWSVADFKARIGTEIGVSTWRDVTQEKVDAFAVSTGDVNYLHVNPERARAQAGMSGTIAHGLFTLSLLPTFAYELTPKVMGSVLGLNYGFDKVRWIAPVPVGSRVRARYVLADAEVKNGSLVLTYDVTVEIEGQEMDKGGKPALIARSLGHSRLSPETLRELEGAA